MLFVREWEKRLSYEFHSLSPSCSLCPFFCLSVWVCVSLSLSQCSLGQLLWSAPVGMVHGSAQLPLQGSLLLYYCMSFCPRRRTDLSDCLSFLSHFLFLGEACLLMASALVHSNSGTAETLALIARPFMTIYCFFFCLFFNKDKYTKHFLLEDMWHYFEVLLGRNNKKKCM